jgi:Putative Ig domain
MTNAIGTKRLALAGLMIATLTACGSDEDNVAAGNQPAPTDTATANHFPTGNVRGNEPPTITGSPPTSILAGTLYHFRPQGQDRDGDQLTYTIRNRPPWAVFDRTTGRLQGIPGTRDAGSYDRIVIGVTDGDATAALQAFKISVQDPNAPQIIPTGGGGMSDPVRPAPSDPIPSDPIAGDPAPAPADDPVVSSSPDPAPDVDSDPSRANSSPTIAGTPPDAILVDDEYWFLPDAADADGDDLVFSARNLPGWMDFNPSTGGVRGAPSAADVGQYHDVTIAVTDGRASAALTFDVTVTAIANGSATVTWAPPTANEDGSPLVNLAGFKVHWGTSSGAYTSSATVDNPGITSFLIEDLVAGTYYFATSAFNSEGVESAYSNEMSAVVRAQ